MVVERRKQGETREGSLGGDSAGHLQCIHPVVALCPP